jgi:hypothetical protein
MPGSSQGLLFGTHVDFSLSSWCSLARFDQGIVTCSLERLSHHMWTNALRQFVEGLHYMWDLCVHRFWGYSSQARFDQGIVTCPLERFSQHMWTNALRQFEEGLHYMRNLLCTDSEDIPLRLILPALDQSLQTLNILAKSKSRNAYSLRMTRITCERTLWDSSRKDYIICEICVCTDSEDIPLRLDLIKALSVALWKGFRITCEQTLWDSSRKEYVICEIYVCTDSEDIPLRLSFPPLAKAANSERSCQIKIWECIQFWGWLRLSGILRKSKATKPKTFLPVLNLNLPETQTWKSRFTR